MAHAANCVRRCSMTKLVNDTQRTKSWKATVKKTAKKCKMLSFSHQHPMPLVSLAKLLWRATLLLAEHSVKVAHIVEPAVVAHLGNGVSAVDKRTRSMTEAHFDHVIGHQPACAQLENG